MTSLPACFIGPESLYPHQRSALRRLLTSRSTFLAHEVGAGKTRVQALAAMEWRRLGLARRTIITAPSGILEQTRREIYSLYPFARLLLLTPGMLQPCNATVLHQTIQGQKPDILLMSHEAFVNLRAPESQRVQQQRLEQEIRARTDDTDLTPTMKQRMIRWREQAEDVNGGGLDISCLDVNALIVDEAHLYKSADTRRGKCLLEISRWLQATGGRIVLASGTPLSNSPQEIFQIQQYLQWDALQQAGLTNLATWMKTFLEPERVPEPSPDGMGYRYKTRLCIAASRDLRDMFGEVEDQVRLKDCDYIARPVCHTITRKCPVSAEQRTYMRNMALSIASGANPLPLMAKGRLASLCPPLAGLPLNKNGKMMQAAAEMARIYHEDKRAGQLVFMDLGVPKRGDGQAYAVLTDLLVQHGVKREHVAWVQEASSRLSREDFFRRYRDGEIRFLIGSTQVLGEGANVQTFTRAIHHMDMPWRPKDLEQRTGRAVRQGNHYEEVLNYHWVSEHSLDMFMRATVSRKYMAFVSCFQENEILECCGDRSREIARCRQIAFWPESVDGFTLEPAELREWRNRLNAAFVAVSGIRQSMFKVDEDHVYPARNWPAIIITDAREIQLENGGTMKLDGENLDGVPLFVWASGMIDRERTLETLRAAIDALNASDLADFSWFAERREDALRLAQRLETVLPVNMREQALAALKGNDDDDSRFVM